MIARETNLLKFMNGPKQFLIPIYQRTYSWTLKECKTLWNDIMKTGKDESIAGYFIGSVVYIESGLYHTSTVSKLLVIDGQQRLTTISLLLAALSKTIEQKGNIGEINSSKLKNYYLINNDEEGELKNKLVLTKSDKGALFKIIDYKELSEEDAPRLVNNYKFFEEQIAKSNIEEVYRGIAKLILIDVTLDREKDNPQLIFESLNSTGLELTQADLIRNYILMGLPREKQEELYRDFWHPLEKNFGHAEYSELFDRFMRDYLTIKTGKIPNIRDVYSAFKLYTQKFENLKELVADIFKYSKYFVNVALEKEEHAEIKSIFSDINTLKVDVSYPFLLNIYDDFKQNIISKEDIIKILKYLESYVFRRAICGIPTNSLNKTFANLYKEIEKEKYLESFKAALLLKDSYRRFPKNKEFRQELLIKDVYNFRSRNYLLRKLENHNRKEIVDVEGYTIEHVMPQKEDLSNEWKEELGEKWKEIRDKYLHTIGNLTLTGYNSELSFKPFKEKRDMEGGFAESPIRLNNSLAKLEHWNEQEILDRAEILIELAIKVWPCPELDDETLKGYKKVGETKPEKEYSIEDYSHLKEGFPMRSLFNELRKRILNLDSSVKEEILKLYIAYKTTTNFVDIVPQKSKLRLSLNMRFEEVNDFKGLCKDVTDKGRWGNGDVELGISSFDELDYAMYLIKQAYNKRTEEEND